MILITIRFLASSGMLITVGDFAGIHKTTAGKHIWNVLQAIGELKSKFLTFPNDPIIIQNIKKDFYNIAKFPKVVGALDCTHVKIQSPGMYLHNNYYLSSSYYKLRIILFYRWIKCRNIQK